MPPTGADGEAAKAGRRDAGGWRPFSGLRPFDASRLGPDILAGITLAALGIPEVMGYTKIIGTPVVTGLYTMLLPMLAFALLGSSRHLVVSADSATAAMVAAAFAALSLEPSSDRYVALTSLVALVVAGMLLLARVLRAGFLADFLSRTVLVGFLTGVGLQVALGEVHGLLGLEKRGDGLPSQLLHTLRSLPETHLPTLGIALTVLLVIWLFERFWPRWPGALFAVAGMIVASRAFHWESAGIRLVGAVPSGLPALGLPEVGWQDARLVLPVAASCLLVILAQSAATSRAFAIRYRDRFDENTDLVGLSLANLAAGLSGTFVVNGSPTKTAMVDTAGGRSQLSHLATVAGVLLVLLFLTGPLAALPNAVLAAIVFHIGWKLVDGRGLARIRRLKPDEFRLAVITTATVVLVGVEEGIVLALVLSLLQHVRRSYQPRVGVLMRDATDRWRLEPAEPGRMILPGMVMLSFGSDLFYANAGRFGEVARELVAGAREKVRWLVIDASAITGIDYSAYQALVELKHELDEQGVTLAVTRVADESGPDWTRFDLTGLFGPDRVFATRHGCLRAYSAETGIAYDAPAQADR